MTTTGPTIFLKGGWLLLERPVGFQHRPGWELEPQTVRRDLLIEGGLIARMGPPGTVDPPPAATVIDLAAEAKSAGGLEGSDEEPRYLISPPFVESHVHLDSALSDAGRCENKSGTLFEGIELWRRKKAGMTVEEIADRAVRALRMQAAQGVLYVRSHADVSEHEGRPLEALKLARDRTRAWTNLQIVAFPQDGLYRRPDQLAAVERALANGADVVGGIPHYELTREDGVASVHKIFELAGTHHPIDVHCDETDDPNSRFLEVMAACAIRAGNGATVTASHTTAFGSYDGGYALKLMGRLAEAGINFVANPLINIVLQGRADDYPKRRGLTRVKELWDRGLNVSLGYDCIMDPWYALGTGNMLDAAHMACHVAQMTGRAQIDACFDMVTWNGAKTLGLADRYGVKQGAQANFVVLAGHNRFDAIRTRPRPRYVFSNGRLLCETAGSQTRWAADL